MTLSELVAAIGAIEIAVLLVVLAAMVGRSRSTGPRGRRLRAEPTRPMLRVVS